MQTIQDDFSTKIEIKQLEIINGQYLINNEFYATYEAYKDEIDEYLKNNQLCFNLDREKEKKLNEIEASFKNAMASLDRTPDEERLTFERQEREAREYLASLDESKAPFLKALALSRGVDLNELAQKVVAKADLYANASATLIGKRQKALDEIKKATTKAELEKIKVEF